MNAGLNTALRWISPDKHGGSKLAERATAWLLLQRSVA